MKTRLGIFVVLCFFAFNQLWGQNNVIDEVVWVVGDDPILKSDVENQRLAAQINGVSIDGDPYCVIPEQLAIQKLFLHQALIDSIEVKDSEVMQELEMRINYMIQMTGSKEKLEEYMREPLSQIRQQQKTQIHDTEVANRVKQKIAGDVKITPAEVRKYYKDIPTDSLPFVPTTYEVQIITQTPKPTRAEIERVESDLREYARRVTAGESDFSTLALLYSQDNASARQGGLLPYMGKAQLVPEFASVAFSLNDPKKVSKIVKTEYGYHIIQFVSRQGDKIQVRHILRKPQIDQSAVKATLNALDTIASDIKSGKITFENAVVMSDDKDTRNNNGLMVSKTEDGQMTPWFQMKDLPQDVARVVANMKVGEVSQPFTMINSKDQQVSAIIKLKNCIPGHRASITADFQTLKSLVLEKRRNEVLDKWIKDKQKKTYIRIKSGWRSCNFHYPGWI